MERIQQLYVDLSQDQKKMILVSLCLLIPIFIYATSKFEDHQQKIVIQSKKSDFKGGEIVSDRASDYYKKKDRLLSRQYDDVVSAQRKLENQLKAIQVSLTKLNETKDSEMAKESQPEISEIEKHYASFKDSQGKKWIQRVQKQLKTSFRFQGPKV